MKMKKTVMKQIKEMTGNFKPDKLAPCEESDLIFVPSPKLVEACQQFGQVCVGKASPKKCYAVGKGVKSADVGARTTAVLHVVNDVGKPCSIQVGRVVCEFESVATASKAKCSIKAKEISQYEISYQPTIRGRHQLHIKVEGEHIKGSPFTVSVKMPVQKLGTPVRSITEVNNPWGVAVNQGGVVEHSGHCVSIFNQKGEKLRSFGSLGSGQGQFSNPTGVAVDDDGNILVSDYSNNRLQKFTSLGKFMAAVNINSPVGISIHPNNKKIVVASRDERLVHILNPDLTLCSSFGENGGKLQGSPYDVAHDSHGNIYVVDSQCKNGIQIFTAEGKYLRKFGSQGNGQGQLNCPTGIAIDDDDVVYVADNANNRVSVFKSDGTFLMSFGTSGKELGQFSNLYGIAVDKDGFIYVSDYNNKYFDLLGDGYVIQCCIEPMLR